MLQPALERKAPPCHLQCSRSMASPWQLLAFPGIWMQPATTTATSGPNGWCLLPPEIYQQNLKIDIISLEEGVHNDCIKYAYICKGEFQVSRFCPLAFWHFVWWLQHNSTKSQQCIPMRQASQYTPSCPSCPSKSRLVSSRYHVASQLCRWVWLVDVHSTRPLQVPNSLDCFVWVPFMPRQQSAKL